MSERRVVITGLGALTPVGNNTEEFWSALKQGKSGIGPITKFDVSAKDAAGEFKYVTGIATSAMAVEDAALDPAKVDATRFGVLIGSGIGGISTLIEGEKVLNEKG